MGEKGWDLRNYSRSIIAIVPHRRHSVAEMIKQPLSSALGFAREVETKTLEIEFGGK